MKSFREDNARLRALRSVNEGNCYSFMSLIECRYVKIPACGVIFNYIIVVFTDLGKTKTAARDALDQWKQFKQYNINYANETLAEWNKMKRDIHNMRAAMISTTSSGKLSNEVI